MTTAYANGLRIPHTIAALHERGRWDTIGDGFVDGEGKTMEALVAEHGAETVTSQVREFLFETGESRTFRTRHAMDNLTAFLRAQDAYGDCSTNSRALSSLVKSKDATDSEWALDRIVEDGCSDLGKVVIKALANDSSRVRRKAAWAVGELGLAAGRKHVYRLRWDDPDWDVRNAAAEAYNKLEIESS